MQFQKEPNAKNSIIAYDNSGIKIGETMYTESLMVDVNQIVPDLNINNLQEIDVQTLIQFSPQIIIVGLSKVLPAPLKLMAELSQKGIGIEVMSIGAACRTYNILLSENRDVLGVFIFSKI